MEHHDDWTRFRLGRLDPTRFEELCAALLTAQDHTEVDHWGAAGGDGGVDILSNGPDGRLWVTQCKRKRSATVTPKAAVAELRKVLDDPPDPPPAVYHLIATCNISRQTYQALEDAAKSAPFPLEIAGIWAESKLVALLRDDHPDLRERFIGPLEKMPFWNVPNRGDYFTGREEILAELATRLEDVGAAALTQAIVGLGGVGKSQTAIEYCHRHRSAYSGGVFWVDA
ncbi:MAG: restriction endonuclease, partial [bacterium]|nr:restriction endonuclease [bacterium]